MQAVRIFYWHFPRYQAKNATAGTQERSWQMIIPRHDAFYARGRCQELGNLMTLYTAIVVNSKRGILFCVPFWRRYSKWLRPDRDIRGVGPNRLPASRNIAGEAVQ